MEAKHEPNKVPLIVYVVITVLILIVVLPREGEYGPSAPPRVERGIFATALDNRLYLNMSLSSYESLSVKVVDKEGREKSVPVPKGGASIVVSMDQKSEFYRFQVLHADKALFRGKVFPGLEPFQTFSARGWLKELLATYCTPPIWIGERLICLNESGMVVCYELHRQLPEEGKEMTFGPSLKVAWLFVPPRLAATWSRRRHKMGGLCALANGFVSFFYKIDDDTLGVCALDVEQRAKGWPKNALPKERHLLPKWVLDKKNEWNNPTKGEFITHYSGLPTVEPVGLALYEQGRLFVQLVKERKAGFLCFDPQMMRINWNTHFEAKDMEKVALHQIDGRWSQSEPIGGARDFSFIGSPRSVGGRMYSLVDTGTYKGINNRQLVLISCRPCVIRRQANARSIGKAIDSQVCFRFAAEGEYRRLNTPIELNSSGGIFRLRRDDYLYEWTPAKSLPRVKRFKNGKRKRPQFIDLLLCEQYEVGRTEELLQVAHPQTARSGKLELPFPKLTKTMTRGPRSIVAITTSSSGLFYVIPLELVLTDAQTE